MKQKFTNLFLSILIMATSGCSNQEDETIKKTVSDFYKNYKGNFREANKVFLSKELSSNILHAIAFEKQSAALIKKSSHPTDKPRMLEGDLFTSIYEGYTDFKIKDCTQKNNNAIVTIDFVNSTYHIHWSDQAVLIHENGWKIDDVKYGSPDKKDLSLKFLLEEFVKLPLD